MIRKKEIIVTAAAILMVCCTSLQTANAVAVDPKQPVSNVPAKALMKLEEGKDVAYYVEMARWGNADAQLRLAHCYRDGIGVKRDFYRALTAIQMYDDYTHGNNSQEFFQELPEDDLMRRFYECTEDFIMHGTTEASTLADSLIVAGIADGYALKAIAAKTNGQEEEFDSLMSKAHAGKSVFGVLATSVLEADNPASIERNLELVESIAPSMPFMYNMLGKHFADESDGSASNTNKAAMYYRKAEESACLDSRNAAWLLTKIQNHELEPADSEETERLRGVCRNFLQMQ